MLKIDAKTKRILLWILLGFVTVVAVLIVWALVKKTAAKKNSPMAAPRQPGNTGTTVPTLPVDVPGTATPPILPGGTSTGSGNGGVVLPSEVLEINWNYINDLAWKMDEVTRAESVLNPGIAAYRCEITNGILEMGARDLSALVQTYRQWYGRSFRDNYCQKVTSSGCWTSLWDSKPQQACNKLKNYA